MGKTGKYIYGIINSEKRGHVTSLNSYESIGPYGISALVENGRDRSLQFIPYQDIAAIVNDAESINYTHMFKDALARALIEHQKVIERIMNIGYSIIPMRLGTFAMDEVEVKDILSKGYCLIKEIIPKISDKIEIDVVATWNDFTATIKEAGEEKEIREFKEQLLKNTKGITVDDQMRAGVMLKNALDQMRERYVYKIQDALVETQCIASLRQHECMDDKMVINIALLVNNAQQKELYAKVEDLNTEFAEKLNFRCVGPLPPYSFYTLEIKKMQFNDVAWARERLGILNDAISKDEIKKIFQRQAFVSHPDKNPDGPEAEKEFDEIKRSYNILLDYAQSCAQVGKESLYFNEDEFKKNAVLVKVRD